MEGCMCWYYLLTFRLQGCLFVVEFKEMFYLTYLGNISRSMLIAHTLPCYNSETPRRVKKNHWCQYENSRDQFLCLKLVFSWTSFLPITLNIVRISKATKKGKRLLTQLFVWYSACVPFPILGLLQLHSTRTSQAPFQFLSGRLTRLWLLIVKFRRC